MTETAANEPDVRELVKSLGDELHRHPEVRAEIRAELADLLEELDAELDKIGPPHPGLIERIERRAALFRATHPDLASAMDRITDQLVKLGF